MNKNEILRSLEASLRKSLNAEDVFLEMGSNNKFYLNDFIDKIYVGEEFSHVRIDIFEREGFYSFRVSTFDPESDSILKSRGINTPFFLCYK